MKKLISIFMSCLLLFNFMTQVSADSVDNTKKENRPKVSIIVPVYKVEPWLRECMNSLVNQTLKDIEIICVDDGSPDNCGKILDEYATKDKRIKVIYQKNKGLSEARNSGLKEAKGEYITFVDSDDYVELNTYEVAYRYAKKDDVDILNFGRRSFKDGQDNHINSLDLSDAPIISVDNYIRKYYNWSVWRNVYKAKLLQNSELNFLSGKNFAEDLCFTQMILGIAKRIKCIPAKFYNYRMRSSSIMGSISWYGFCVNSLNKIKEICDFWRKNDCLKDNEHKLLSLIIRSVPNRRCNAYLDCAQEILNSLGSDIYNSETVKKCPRRIQKILKCLEQAASKKIENKSKLRERIK